MLLNTAPIRETRLFSYTIASAEMRYIPIGERTIYLRNDATRGPILRGEIGEHGVDSHANLSQILLEYAMSCEGCRNSDRAAEMSECLGDRLGRLVTKKLDQNGSLAEQTMPEKVQQVFAFILHSMDIQYQIEHKDNQIYFYLANQALDDVAQHAGLSRGIVPARMGFVAICSSILNTLAPEWKLQNPTAQQIQTTPIANIVIQT